MAVQAAASATDAGPGFAVLVAPATREAPRNSEGDVEVLKDGRLLLAYTEIGASGSDHDPAVIYGRTSSDGGRSWGDKFVLARNHQGARNAMIAALLRLRDGRIMLGYNKKNSLADTRYYVRFSSDEGGTWSQETLVTPKVRYGAAYNYAPIQLRSGRILIPYDYNQPGEYKDPGHFVVQVHYSDDGGHSWRESPHVVDLPKRGAMEPGLVELKEGSVMMVLRTQLGRIYLAESRDQGLTWGMPRPTELKNPESPAAVARIPSTGDLLMIYNNNYNPGGGHHLGERCPLSSAISKDEGRTWVNLKDIETDPAHEYSYPSITFQGDRLLLTYYQGTQTGKDWTFGFVFHSLPVSWLYQPAGARIEAAKVWAPVIISTGGPGRSGVIPTRDGALKTFITKEGNRNYSVVSRDGGVTWGEEKFEYEGPAAFLPLLDRDGEYHLFPVVERREGAGRTPGLDYFIDIWHMKTHNAGTVWQKPKMIFKGYVGSINGLTQLSSGRILLPFAAWVGGRPEGPPAGANVSTLVYSDDGGNTWQKSPAELTAPCYTDFNGSGYGACEPSTVELTDGRVYALVRTETGVLYESYSPDGVNWEELRPSRFLSSDAPVAFLRLPDKRLLVFWNGCEKPPRVGGNGVYGGRDALHAAISGDDGKTWRGYREVYRDPTRNDPPQRFGDRGTAYPFAYMGKYGKVIVASGQGRSDARVMFDPDWLLETSHRDDFSRGLEGWSVFKSIGPASRWWRNRVQGAVLIDHPDRAGAKALHVRRSDENDGDGALWNFPMGRKGDLKMRIKLQEGFGGSVISLLDRFFDPQDATGDADAIYSLTVTPDGNISLRNKLEKGRWYDLRFQWDVPKRTCVVSVAGEPTVWLKPSYRPAPGINYVRFRSTAQGQDLAGMLIESVEVDVEP